MLKKTKEKNTQKLKPEAKQTKPNQQKQLHNPNSCCINIDRTIATSKWTKGTIILIR